MGRRAMKNNKNAMADALGNDNFLRDAMIGAFTTFDFFGYVFFLIMYSISYSFLK